MTTLVPAVKPAPQMELFTERVKVEEAVFAPLNAFTVTIYVPACFASVTVTMPVVGFTDNTPLKFVFAKATMAVVLVGEALGVTVVFDPEVTIALG